MSKCGSCDHFLKQQHILEQAEQMAAEKSPWLAPAGFSIQTFLIGSILQKTIPNPYFKIGVLLASPPQLLCELQK